MDPYQNQRGARNRLQPSRDSPGGAQTPEDPHTDAPDRGNQTPGSRQPQYSSGYTLIPPNDSLRSKIKMMAQKEEEALQRWKEENRPAPVQLNPERLGGGNVTLAGAREKQFSDLRCSKLQKKLRKEEQERRRRQQEEDELQKMKDEQRAKAERLQERRRQEDQRRREQFGQDRIRKTERFLQRFERTASAPLASGSATHTSSRSEAVESQQKEPKSERDVELEHRRVNSAFLDRLEGRGRASEKETKEEGVQEDIRHQRPNQSGQQLPSAHLNADPEQSYSDCAEDDDSDYDWALMKLMSSFPDCSRVFLEDILDQCNNDYNQAYTLLNCTLN
ncbi:epithelial-stromal interaction protein 1 [Plectropomus leopardus]|uniref:epithelial-stromal interaction protein 1 n=1 Tax=Plectropomus leopardus TaxID=160734 RepID=UPI001C4AB649|nr:epithelial-stromal interaction protein 1 [Plectropomus leopardus]